MIDKKRYCVQLIGSGSYVPKSVLSNFDLEKMVKTSDEWIRTRTGISERHIASEGELTSDLAAEAALLAIKNAKITAQDIDLIVVATVTPDMLFPSTACFVQKKIKAFRAVAFDVSAACSGFVYAMHIARSFIQSGQHKTVLVIGAELLSKFVDWKDRNTCVLFGDGAGAVVLTSSQSKESLLYSSICSDPEHTELLYLDPLKKYVGQESRHSQTIQMKGNDVFRIAIQTMVESVQNALKACSLLMEDIEYIIPHQANIRIINSVSKRLNCPKEKMIVNLDQYGNTSAATIPLALDELLKKKPISKTKDQSILVLCVAFGAGFTSGSFLLNIQSF